jgi:hypothetical protein
MTMDDSLRHLHHRLTPYLPLTTIRQQLVTLKGDLIANPSLDPVLIEEVCEELDLAVNRLQIPNIPLAVAALCGAVGCLERESALPQRVEQLQAVMDLLES